MSKLIDISGRVFSRLTVLKYDGDSRWLCVCVCGNTRRVRKPDLNNGNTVSCGCYAKSRLGIATTKHGHQRIGNRTPEYMAWRHMKSRCYNPNIHNYHNYGGRGIIVCERWINSFENFLEDMGVRPSERHSVDRYPDKNGNYEPTNCRWATKKEQSRNLRTNRWIEYNGDRRILSDWAYDLRVCVSNLSRMIKKSGESLAIQYYKTKLNE
jgi:hypothetical protein